jgi:hypothetical protein
LLEAHEDVLIEDGNQRHKFDHAEIDLKVEVFRDYLITR